MSLPLPVLSPNINGASTALSGSVVSLDREWLVLNNVKCEGMSRPQVWIPRPVILLIEQN